MIRINLVGEGRKPVVAKSPTSRGPFFEEMMSGENAAVYWLLVPVALALIVGGIYWWTLRGTIADNRDVIAERQRRVNELQEIIARVEAYEREAAELERKIEVITELKDNQRGPVEMMDTISRALPELLWINRLDQNGERIQIDGQALNFNAISNFIEALDDSSLFMEPELNDSQERGDTFTYRITLQIERPDLPDEDVTS